ncbi:MAG: dockerin type I domain-containing protein [Candidatus Poribacteria bacterium]|nr:dockerin type I domain-containing protein [Candidatus Poribacteria bacterium]
MKDIQKYYQSEMTRHGFTDKTFPLETDENGKLVIHTINAKHDSEHYDIGEDRHWDLIEPELPFKFNNQQNWNSRDNVHLIIIGGLEMHGNWRGGPAMGFAWHGGRSGGNAIVTMDIKNDFPHHYLGVVAHELGHAFALDPGHNNYNNGESLNGTVIAWGDTTEEWGNRMQMTKEEAILLDSRPIFRKINLQEDTPKSYENINVLMYTGAVSWVSPDDANLQSQMTKQLLSSKGIQAEIVQTEDAVRDWMLQTTSDGNVDVLILYGILPTSIYQFPNSQSDGSVAEIWIESTDGNTILNHGDYFGFVDSNGVQTLQDIMDIPHITMWDFGLENNTPMIVTKDGKEMTPSLTNFQSDRAFHLDELTGDWFAEKVLASNTGTSQATRADPVIVRDGNLGRIGIVYQTFNEVNPKGKVAAELIANFLLENNDKISLPPVEPIIDEGTGGLSDMVSLLPASVQSPNIGQQLKLSLKIASGENVAGYQATVQFDTTALHYVSSTNGDFLPVGAFFVEPKVEGNLVKLNAASLAGENNGDGILATLTFEVVAVKASTLTLSDVLLTNRAGETFVPQVENAEITEPIKLKGDINGDGTVNIADLVLVASNLGETGQNAADVNGDGQVNIADLVLVAGALSNSAAAPSLNPQALKMITATEVKQWLSAAQRLNLTDTTSQRGILFLQQLLTALIPKKTALLPNYPNPFNPETWIPYHLAKDADVTLHIYAVNGALVRTLALGHQAAGMYQSRSRAAYWDGKNEFGESVASSVYFYKLTTDGFMATRKMLILK